MTTNEQGRARIVTMALAEGLCVEQESKFDPSTIHIGGYIEGIERLLQRYAQEAADRAPGVMTDERIDAHIDAILKAAGSALRHYTLPKSLEGMRDAARAIEQEVIPPLLAEVERYRGFWLTNCEQLREAHEHLAHANTRIAELERQLAAKERETLTRVEKALLDVAGNRDGLPPNSSSENAGAYFAVHKCLGVVRALANGGEG